MLARPDVTDRAALEEQLGQLGSSIKGSSCTCPNPEHDDHNPSASIHCGKDGHWRVTCHTEERSWDAIDLAAMAAGMDLGQFMRATRDPVANSGAVPKAVSVKYRPKTSRKSQTWPTLQALKEAFPQAQAVHPYTDPANDRIDLVVIRRPYGTDKPKVLQFAWNGRAFVPGGCPNPQPLYNRRRMRDATEVMIVEGEADVEALHDLGIVATTAPMGAGKASRADWTPLAGKNVIIWPDHDEIGARHADEVAELLLRLRPLPHIRRLNPSALNLQPKGDASDWIDEHDGQSAEELRTLLRAHIERAETISPAAPLLHYLDEITSGRRRLIRWPWPILNRLMPLIAGSVVLLVGPEGSGKSLMLGQCLLSWCRQGEPVGALMLEKDSRFYQLRALAQLEEAAHFTAEDWAATHAEAFKAATLRHEAIIATIRGIFDTPTGAVGSGEVLQWIERRLADGARLVLVDPISGMDETERMSEDHKRLVIGCQQLASNYLATVLLCSHPRMGWRGKPDLDGVAGGKAMTRFADALLWLNPHDNEHHGPVRTQEVGIQDMTFNRVLHLLKTRSSKGEGMGLALNLDRDRLHFDEFGIAMPQKRRGAVS